MVTILMMSAKIATPGFLKIKVFWNKGYDELEILHQCGKRVKTKSQKVMGAFRPATSLKKGSNTSVFLWMLRFFYKQLFLKTTSSSCFYLYSKGKKRKTWKNGGRKIFQMSEENKNISFNFYLQVLVRVKTEIEIQLCKY